MYIGLRTYLYGPRTTSFFGGSKTAGVPSPRVANSQRHQSTIATPMASGTSPSSPNGITMPVPGGMTHRSGTNTRTNAMNNAAKIAVLRMLII